MTTPDVCREAIFEMDRQIGTWLCDYAPGQSWLRALQAAYGVVAGVPTDAQIEAEREQPGPKVYPHHGCTELAEAGRLAVSEALSVERIAENLTSLFQQAFPTTDRDETAYLIDSWIWAEGAAALRAALSPEQHSEGATE